MAAAVPSQCGTTAFKQWCHCLCNAACLWNAAALHPNTAALPVECSSIAFRMWQHCLWTAAALLLDSDTVFSLRQHCLQLEAAMPSHGSGTAFPMRQHCLQFVAAIPSHDSGSASTVWQHCLQLVAGLPSHASGSASTMWQHCLQTVVPLPLQRCMPWKAAALHPNTAALPVDCSNTTCGRQQHCCWAVTLPPQRDSTAFSWRQHCLHMAAAVPS